MIGESVSPGWLATDWVLGWCSQQRKRAIKYYVECVRAGRGYHALWDNLQNQIFLGSDVFISKQQSRIKQKETPANIPQLQTRDHS